MGLSPKGHLVSAEPGSGLPLLNGPTEFGVTYPTPRQWTRKWSRTAEPGDTLFCVRGSTTGRMNVAQLQYAIGRGVAAIRGATPADTRFIRYAIVNGLPNILALTSGSVFPNISAGDLRNFQLPWPDEKERLAIAAILGALDDKIESNRLLVQLIPQVIRAKVLAALAEHRDEVAVTALAGFVNGGAYTKGATGTGRMVIRIADLNSGPGRSTVYNDIDVPDDRTARPGDILMSWSGSLDVYRWALEEAIVNQHIFKVLPTDYPAWLVFDRLEAVIHVFQLVARDKATTMGHIQRGHLETTRVEVPTTADIARLDKALSPLWDRLLIVEQETIKLARLRDTLLPELLSGRIGAPEVAEGVEAAA